MGKGLGQMHNLRLLRFDSQDTNISKAFKRQVRKSTPRVKKKLNLRPDYFLAKRAKFISTKSSSETFLQAKTTNKCKNTPFKRPSIQFKRPVIKRSASLYELKQKFSNANCQVANKTKEALRYITSKSLRSKRCKPQCNNQDVRVLFTTEIAKNHRNDIQNDVRKLDRIYNTRSSKLCNFKSNQHLYRCSCHTSRADLNYKCSRNFNEQTECNKDSQTIKNSIYEFCKPSDYNYPTLDRYIQADVTCSAPDQPGVEGISRLSTNERCNFHSRCIGVTPSCFNIPRNGSGDTNNFNDHILKQKIKNPKCESKITQIQEMGRCQEGLLKFERESPTFSGCAGDRKSLPTSILKGIIFIVIVILWSPCIIIVCFCWLLTYPVRPFNLFEKNDFTTKNRYCNDGSRGGWELGRLFHNISQRLQYTANTIYSVFKRNESTKSDCLNPPVVKTTCHKNLIFKSRHNLCADPRMKYCVYYKRNKGWVMKPYKKRKTYTNKHMKLANSPNSSYFVITSPPEVFTNKEHNYEDRPLTLQDRPILQNQEKSDKDLDIKYRKNIAHEPKTPEPVDFNHLSDEKSYFHPPYQKRSVSKKSLNNIPCDLSYSRIPNYRRCNRPRRYKKIYHRPICPRHGRKQNVLNYPPCKSERNILHQQCGWINVTKKDHWCKRTFKTIANFVNNADRNVWKYNVCKPMPRHDISRTVSCSSLKKRCPSFPMNFSTFCKFYGSIVMSFMFMINTCIWLPTLYCCYFCFSCFFKTIRNI
ncbi:uncharacterized protein LOC116766844 [Danaus plexippus]|uniref:uncharacterized protein LOC116766844 n=1 Tax=Danaus plexippus TaxID=13037 RepID=UPI002AAFD495|nr:uncharacterized protein LOC116766844 [Danaus plexippus]